MKTLLILLIILSGCKEVTDIEYCNEELNKSKIRIAGLELKITKLKLNRTDVLEERKDRKEVETELKELKSKFNELELSNMILKYENKLLLEFVKDLFESNPGLIQG